MVPASWVLLDDATGPAVMHTRAGISERRAISWEPLLLRFILGLSLPAAVVLAVRNTLAIRRSNRADWRALAMLAGVLTVVLLSGVVFAQA